MTENIGGIFLKARKSKGLSIEDVSQTTCIRPRFIRAMEEGDFSIFPSDVQARGFIRTYAETLGLDLDQLFQEMETGLPLAPILIKSKDSSAQEQELETKSEKESSIEADSTDIFREIGYTLKKHREDLGFSIDAVEQRIHIKTHYLQALESGTFEALPSPVQGRGMLINYASFLGLDVDQILLRFSDGYQTQLAEKQQKQNRKPSKTRLIRAAPIHRMVTSDLLMVGSLGIFIISFVIWGSIRIVSIQINRTPTQVEISVAEIFKSTPTLHVQGASELTLPVPVSGTDQIVSGGSVELTQVPASNAPVNLYIIVHQSAWLRVTVDNKVEFERRVITGSAYQFSGNKQIEILTGNGAALQVYYNQTDVGVLGLFGEVVNQIYTADQMITPTATSTPTKTPTPITTPTKAITPTLAPEGN